jgi:signal transduction histidine kinase
LATALLVVLVVLAARADMEAPSASTWLTVLDLLVGLAFIAGAISSGGPLAERGLVALAGAAWLVGSLRPGAGPWHQAVLLVALTAFPAGRVRGPIRWMLVALAGIVALGLVARPAVAGLFLAVSVVAWRGPPRERRSAGFPTCAAGVLAAVLGSAWFVAREWPIRPTPILVAYEVALLGIALGFVLATRAVVRARMLLVDQLVADTARPALESLSLVLGNALDDPDVRVYRRQGLDYVDDRGDRMSVGAGDSHWLVVTDTKGPVAVVVHGSRALEDPDTAAAVTSAVRLTLDHVRLQEEQQQRLSELTAARLRIVAVTDRQRLRIATELSRHVEPALRVARSELWAARSTATDRDVAATLEMVAGELSWVSGQLAGLVAGVPPAELRSGLLKSALMRLVATSPCPVAVTVAEDAVASSGVNTALFYVCSESLANAVKHARASQVTMDIRRVARDIVVTVSDDGRGGADPSGSGLQGLADRVATHGGRLRVMSPPGAGTTVTATVPA